MAAEVTNPITQVVDCNEKYIRLVIRMHWLGTESECEPA
jgi:hypothetical protein